MDSMVKRQKHRENKIIVFPEYSLFVLKQMKNPRGNDPDQDECRCPVFPSPGYTLYYRADGRNSHNSDYGIMYSCVLLVRFVTHK